ncbi:hypothetical protein NEOLEDRAFT_1131161 [Neolentinus lepideus HHB14362 ss-1]|uniref:P-loop containing nucleoside triphosphate hydrolase protein n=1 Tax=Neolentinus lepideus HHB14362 ss-1 TaxID=1314782 RepID=A0A165TTI9_9AGAM|nr:hypothetical protein NEOLEDRAFT_1131161 [Neolentinus lepideus HHB14362 ss-1]
MLQVPTSDDTTPEVCSPVSESRGTLTSGGVGLSDPTLSRTRRRLLDLINRLHSTGVQKDIDLPVIAVIGSQSVGKSSLIESISGITLPRSSGTCTRCPTECKLSTSTEPWQCKISLRFETDEHGQPLGQARNVPFGETIHDKADVEERIRRGQLAVLNPGVSPRNFLEDDDIVENSAGQLAFTTNSICLQISGPDVADLSFVDLPGLIASVSQGGDIRDIELVKELVHKYIKKPSCIILLTVTCEVDFETQGAYQLAMEADPERKRIIGVLTKPDRIPADEEDNWLRYIRNEREPLDNGWFCVKLPNSKALSAGISWEQARADEDQFFSYTSPWSSLDSSEQKHLRTRNLTECLSHLLSELIQKRLPEIQDELQNMLRKTEVALRELPPPPSADPVAEVLNMIADFMRRLSLEIKGTSDENGLLQQVRPEHVAFKWEIRKTAPVFRAYEKKRSVHSSNSNSVIPPAASPHFMAHEDGYLVREDEARAIYIDEVMDRARKAVSRELPDKYPFEVTLLFIKEFTQTWRDPAVALFDKVHDQFVAYMKKMIEEQFPVSRYPHSGLPQRIMVIVADILKQLADRTKERIEWLLELEEDPFTLNAHYYQDYKDKFLAYYKKSRHENSGNKSFLSNLGPRGKPSSPSPTPQKKGIRYSVEVVEDDNTGDVDEVLAILARLGRPGLKAEDLARLLPSDSYAPAIEIMAETRAYFQVAYKRVTDNIPLAIDRELIRGLEKELQQGLYKGLGISGPDSARICRELTQEPANNAARREELNKKRERLESAKAELLRVGM